MNFRRTETFVDEFQKLNTVLGLVGSYHQHQCIISVLRPLYNDNRIASLRVGLYIQVYQLCSVSKQTTRQSYKNIDIRQLLEMHQPYFLVTSILNLRQPSPCPLNTLELLYRTVGPNCQVVTGSYWYLFQLRNRFKY